ncbi:hypothetical protein [uncultured Duncaniella sp.]|uniref:hypothetical protein n=1 Tax=uncultured Duncaniella sp. TaxID=2768039 RepID=UPI002665D5CA|nr:hypothetical protein [uncultured Duncaniella sp.]
MVIILLGASGAGKSYIQTELVQNYGFRRIISYTTRSPRVGEQNHIDYHFVSDQIFDQMLSQGKFAEYSEYTQNRKYATLKQDYLQDDDSVVVLTPEGLRSVQQVSNNQYIRTVLITCSLGRRIKRYIDRIGEIQFNFDDKNEIASRVDRDYGMFLNMEHHVDFVIANNGDRSISEIAAEIVKKCKSL